MTVSPIATSAPQFSPMWWTDRLFKQIQRRQPEIDLHRRYADGDHDMPSVAERASKAFRRIMGYSVTNLTGVIIESTAERLGIQGFRFGDDPDADADAWRIWQTSDLDAEFELGTTAALTDARSFLLVEPPTVDDLPRLYVEDASQMIVAYAPGNRTQRLAALKVWTDEWTGDLFATLYLPTSLHKLRADNPRGGGNPAWELRNPDVAGELNPLREVPVFELRNRPRLSGDPRSEIADVLHDQDRANHIALNALIAAEYGAFRQKWATGIEVPRVPVLNADNTPKLGPDGEPIMRPVEPFDVAVNRALISESPDARFGDFNATDLKPYIDLYESTVKHMAAVSQTPISTFGVVPNVSAEAMALSVMGLVSKVKRRAKHFEQPVEAALRLAFRSIGDPRGQAESVETIWRDPEVRSRAQEADAAVKLVQANVIPWQQAVEDLGYSETQRRRMVAWRSEDDALGQFANLLTEQAGGLGGSATDGFVPPGATSTTRGDASGATPGVAGA